MQAIEVYWPSLRTFEIKGEGGGEGEGGGRKILRMTTQKAGVPVPLSPVFLRYFPLPLEVQ